MSHFIFSALASLNINNKDYFIFNTIIFFQ